MKVLVLFCCLFLVSCGSLFMGNGIIVKETSKSPEQVEKIAKNIFKKKGITLFKVVEHHKGAKKIGKKLDQTILLIFGNPKMGTPLMQESRSAGLDLPMKILISKENGKTLVRYNDPAFLKKRHNLKNDKIISKMTAALEGISNKLTK